MIRARIFLFLSSMTAMLIACSSPSTISTPEKISVIATTTIVGDVVQNVAGDQISLSILLPTGTDPHAFEPKPRDLATISDANLIFANGAGLELFLDSLLQNAGAGAKTTYVSEGIQLRALNTDASNGTPEPDHGGIDPHTWQNPLNVIIWTENIARALSKIDPSNAAFYRKNADTYISELQALDIEIQKLVDEVPFENRQLVLEHETLGYFADRYNFEIVNAVFPGFSTLASPSARELSSLEDQIRQLNVPAIFTGNTVSAELSEQIAQDTGAQIVFIYTDALSSADKPAATYIKFMEYNAKAIVEALK